LIRDGWIITDEPYRLRRGLQTLYVDLGAEAPIAAERAGQLIAVEIKSLLTTIDMPELERALGQYILYRSLLKRSDPERSLYLGLSRDAYRVNFSTTEGRDLIEDENLKLLVFDPDAQEIREWIE
jgi:hypothetical protein